MQLEVLIVCTFEAVLAFSDSDEHTWIHGQKLTKPMNMESVLPKFTLLC